MACSVARKAAMPADVGSCTGAAGSDWEDLVATALPRVRALAAASERACCLPAVALGLMVAAACPPPADCLAAKEPLLFGVGSAGTGRQQSGNLSPCREQAHKCRLQIVCLILLRLGVMLGELGHF